MSKHTQAPTVDVVKIFPFLAGREKTTIRLHPRKSSDIPINSSKIGGRFLWPESEPWPVCSIPEIALLDDYDRSHPNNNFWPVGHPKHNDAYTGVLQLRADDFPQMEFPAGKNLFQLLWCPRDHDFSCGPACKTYWRKEEEIGQPLLEIPMPRFVHEDYVPDCCSLDPELVVEYPLVDPFSADSISSEQSLAIQKWEKKKNLEPGFYHTFLSVAPGTKIGGYVNWIQYPEIPICSCGSNMTHLLTIDSIEFDPGNYSRWCPTEDLVLWKRRWESDEKEVQQAAADVQFAAELCLGDVGRMYFFVCQSCPDWPVKAVLQCC